MTIREALTKGMIILKSNNIDSPKLRAKHPAMLRGTAEEV